MDINTEDVVRNAMQEFTKQYRELKTLNIIVVGKTGVGKSTLINAIFRDKFADTGTGRPVTTEINRYTKANYPLTIYDTPGFELGEQAQKIKDEVRQLIQKGAASRKLDEMIHCIWYCINVGSNRTLDDSEIEWLRSLTEEFSTSNVPVLIILTQAFDMDDARDMKNDIERLNLHVAKVLPVVAQEKTFNRVYTVNPYGLEELVKVMAEVLPKELRTTFQNVQIASLEEKKKQAQGAVATAVTAATAAGASPIPFSDMFVLIPIEVTMIASITIIFGMELDQGFLTAFLSSVLGTGGATLLGRTVVTNIVKLIPGANVASMAVSGATAGTLTTALGEAYIGLMEWMFKNGKNADYLKSAEGRQRMKDDFNNFLK